jgi:hypothetical protein
MKIKLTLCLVALSAVALFTGCAIGGGASVRRDVTTGAGTNSVHTVEKARLHPFVAFGDAVQQVGKMKVGNTKTGNSIGVTGYDSETSATNVPAVIQSAGELIGVAANAFVKP